VKEKVPSMKNSISSTPGYDSGGVSHSAFHSPIHSDGLFACSELPEQEYKNRISIKNEALFTFQKYFTIMSIMKFLSREYGG